MADWRIPRRAEVQCRLKARMTGLGPSRRPPGAIDDAELSETRIKQREYWTAFHLVLDGVNGPVAGNRKPQPQSWMGYGIGRSSFNLGAAMNRLKNHVRAELYIAGDNAKAFLGLLLQQREAIEQGIGLST